MINWQNAYNTPGWMLWRDLILLGIIAKHTSENSNFVEIGSFVGRSTLAIKDNLPLSTCLTSIDPLSTEIWSAFKMGPGCLGDQKDKEDSKIYSNWKAMVKIAQEHNSWIPSFNYCTNFVESDKWKLITTRSDDYTVPQDMDIDAVFIDGDHSSEQVERDICKFIDADPKDEMLMLGHDLNLDHHDDIYPALVRTQRHPRYKHRRRILVQMQLSEIWFLWPTKGKWANLLPQIINEVNHTSIYFNQK
jgi:hypothetical protein